jgi:hypothetical protein
MSGSVFNFNVAANPALSPDACHVSGLYANPGLKMLLPADTELGGPAVELQAPNTTVRGLYVSIMRIQLWETEVSLNYAELH